MEYEVRVGQTWLHKAHEHKCTVTRVMYHPMTRSSWVVYHIGPGYDCECKLRVFLRDYTRCDSQGRTEDV